MQSGLVVGEAIRLGNSPREFRQLQAVSYVVVSLFIFSLVNGLLVGLLLLTFTIWLILSTILTALFIRKEYFVRPSFVTLTDEGVAFEFRLRPTVREPWTNLRGLVVWTGERRYGLVKAKGCALTFNNGRHALGVTYEAGMRMREMYREKMSSELPVRSPY